MNDRQDFEDSGSQPGAVERTTRHLLWRIIRFFLIAGLIGFAVTQWIGKSEAVERYDELKNDSLPAARAVRDSALADRDTALGALGTVTDSVEVLVTVIDDFTPEVIYRTIRVGAPPSPGEPAGPDTATIAFIVLDSIPYEVPVRVAEFGEACLTLKAECAMVRTRFDSLLAAIAVADTASDHVDDVTDDVTDAADDAIHGFKIFGLIPAPEIQIGFGAGVPVICSSSEETSVSFDSSQERTIETKTITKCPNVVGVVYAGIGWSFSIW